MKHTLKRLFSILTPFDYVPVFGIRFQHKWQQHNRSLIKGK